MEDDEKMRKSLFKFGLISRLIHIEDKKERQNIIRNIVNEEQNIPGSIKKKLTSKTLLNYIKRYESKGFEGLNRKIRKDKGKSKKHSDNIIKKIKHLKEEDPKRSARQIMKLLKSSLEFQNIPLKERTISRVLKNNGLNRRNLCQKRINYAFEKEHINELWQADITDGIPLRSSGKMTYLFAFIDDYSRIIPHAQFYFDEKLPRLEDTLKKSILKRGIPKALYVDNGKIFDTYHLSRICAMLGIRLMHHLPYSPQSKGKIERFFQRIQKEFMSEARFADISSLDELNSFLQTWIEIEYHRVEHQAIGVTPLDRYTNDMKNVKLRTIESIEEITEIFLYREKRKVHPSDGSIKLNGNTYCLNNHVFLGTEVEVRYDPFDMSKVFIYSENKYSETALPRDLKNPVFRNIPEEKKTAVSIIRQSSMEFFSRLKQKELEISRKERRQIDFSRIKKEDSNA